MKLLVPLALGFILLTADPPSKGVYLASMIGLGLIDVIIIGMVLTRRGTR